MEPDERRQRAAERLHILDAIALALERRHELFDLLDRTSSSAEAAELLQTEWGLAAVQVQAILDLQLRRFAPLERNRIFDEQAEFRRKVEDLSD